MNQQQRTEAARTGSADFYQGFAAAVSTLARTHNMPSVAVDVMDCNGVTLRDLFDARVEDFDLDPLRKEWAAQRRRT